MKNFLKLSLLAYGCAATSFAPVRAVAEIQLLPSSIKSGRLAFTYKEGKQSDIYMIDFGTKTVKPLLATPVDDEYPVWSPDGSRLVFYSDKSGDREIWSMNGQGGDLVQLTKNKGVDEDPDWSPDGKQIIFRRERNGGKGSDLFIMPATGAASGAEAQRVTDDKHTNTVPRFSPDGSKVLHSTNAFWPGWDIVLLDLKSKQSTKQTSGVRTFCHADWSPDGERFLYSHGGGKDINIWVQDLQGKEERITNGDGPNYDGAWMDNDHILFVRPLNDEKENYQIFLVNLKTKAIEQITKGPGAIRDLSWTATQ